jgi:Tol biopolymer transport system component
LLARFYVFSAVALTLVGCAQTSGGLGIGDQIDPALSGNGRLLATVAERGGRRAVRLLERNTGRELALPGLQQGQPHSSPSLSWNGRYLAMIQQRGGQKQVVLLDRAQSQWRPLALPPDRVPERLSISPDGQRLALQVLRQGQEDVELFRLPFLEPDLPAGTPLR